MSTAPSDDQRTHPSTVRTHYNHSTTTVRPHVGPTPHGLLAKPTQKCRGFRPRVIFGSIEAFGKRRAGTPAPPRNTKTADTPNYANGVCFVAMIYSASMQTQRRSNPLSTHRQPSRYPERRMAPISALGCPFLGLPIRAIRGRLGDRVYKTYGDKIIITRVPCFDGYIPTAAQRDRRDRMRAATAFAQAVYADPAAKAVYVTAAKALGRQPFRLAVSDFLHGRTRLMGAVRKSAKSGPVVVPPNQRTRSRREGNERDLTRNRGAIRCPFTRRLPRWAQKQRGTNPSYRRSRSTQWGVSHHWIGSHPVHPVHPVWI